MAGPIHAVAAILANVRPKGAGASGELEIHGSHGAKFLQWNAGHIAIGASAHTAAPIQETVAKAHVVVIEGSTRCKCRVREIPVGPSRAIAISHAIGGLHSDPDGIPCAAGTILEEPHK